MKHFFALLALLLLVTGCAQQKVAPPPKSEPTNNADLSCAYFYFLWGSHAEYSQRFNEALEAYQKALICDPQAVHIQKKIPLLLIRLGQKEKATAWLEKAIVAHPEDTTQQLLLAQLNAQKKNWHKARILYEQVLEKEPKNERALFSLGRLYAHQKQYPAAEKAFRTLISNHPEIYLGHLYLARLLLINERFSEAAEKYQDALKLNWSTSLIFEMTVPYVKQGDFATVLTLYKKILEEDSDNEQAILGFVGTLQELGRNQEALSELQRFYTQNEMNPILKMALSKLLLREDRKVEALKLLEQLSETPLSSEANYLRALLAYQENNFHAALNYLANIAREAKEYPEAIYLQVRILRDLRDNGQAQQILEKAIANNTSHPLFYALLASLYQEQEQKIKAQTTLEHARKIFPESTFIIYEYALLLERNGKHLDAVNEMQQLLKIKEDHAEALNFVGYSWADRNINLEQAYRYILRAVKLDPESGYIRDSLGWVLFRLGKIKEAQQELLRALEMDSTGDPHIYEHLGDVHAALGLLTKAREFYLKGLEICQTPEHSQRIQKKIDELSTP